MSGISISKSSGSVLFNTTRRDRNMKPVTGNRAYYMRASVNPRSRLISHPVESGGQIFDNKVLDPIMVSVQITFPNWDSATSSYQESVSTLKQMWRNRKFEFYRISLWDGDYDNMCLESMNHDETPDEFNVLNYSLTFKQVIFGGKASAEMADAANQAFKKN